MKKINTTIILFFSLFVIVSCNGKIKDNHSKKKQKETKKNNEVKKQSLQNSITFEDFSLNRSPKKGQYTQTLKVVSGIKDSRVNLSNNTIILKTPVSNTNFTHVATYDISKNTNKALLYIITDSSNIHSDAKNYLLNGTISFQSIISTHNGFSITKDQPLKIMILHDAFNYTINQKNEIIECIKNIDFKSITCGKLNCIPNVNIFQPKTACGGIIVDYN